MKEQDIQRKIIKFLESRGVWCCKVITATRAGIPDIICCIDSKLVAIEAKRHGGHPTALQQYELEKIVKAGGVGIVAHSVEEVREKLGI